MRPKIAQGKHAESVRRPGDNGDYVRVPRPLWPQSAKLTGAKEAMELAFLACYLAPLLVVHGPGRRVPGGASAAQPLAGMSHPFSWPGYNCYM